MPRRALPMGGTQALWTRQDTGTDIFILSDCNMQCAGIKSGSLFAVRLQGLNRGPDLMPVSVFSRGRMASYT